MLKHLALPCLLWACTDNALAPVAIESMPLLGSTAPTLLYSTTRPSETETYAQLPGLAFQISDPTSVASLSGFETNCQLAYQPLTDASGSLVTITQRCLIAPIAIPIGAPPPPPPDTRVVLINPNGASRGFAPMTVYRMKFQLLDASRAPLGPESGWAYSITGNTSANPSGTLKLGRIDMVLRALVQLGDAEAGLIGAGGSEEPDGTRFVSTAHPSYHTGDEVTGWCDWFYRYLGVIVTDGLDGKLAADPVAAGGNTFWGARMNPNNVPNAFRDPLDDGCGTELVDLDHDGTSGDVIANGCQSYTATQVALDTGDNEFFSDISTNVYYDATGSLASSQLPGNYQAMDRHAGMFLAFDPHGDGSSSGTGTVGTVWSIEGNVNDTVKVMHRAADDPIINGFGKLDLSMFQP